MEQVTCSEYFPKITCFTLSIINSDWNSIFQLEHKALIQERKPFILGLFWKKLWVLHEYFELNNLKLMWELCTEHSIKCVSETTPPPVLVYHRMLTILYKIKNTNITTTSQTWSHNALSHLKLVLLCHTSDITLKPEHYWPSGEAMALLFYYLSPVGRRLLKFISPV